MTSKLLSRPICAANARAVRTWSPVIIFARMPAPWHLATARIASRRALAKPVREPLARDLRIVAGHQAALADRGAEVARSRVDDDRVGGAAVCQDRAGQIGERQKVRATDVDDTVQRS